MSAADLCDDVVKYIFKFKAEIELRELEPHPIIPHFDSVVTWYRPEMKQVYYNYSLINKQIHSLYVDEYYKLSQTIDTIKSRYPDKYRTWYVVPMIRILYYTANPNIKIHPSDLLRSNHLRMMRSEYDPSFEFRSPSLWEKYIGYFLWYKLLVEPTILLRNGEN